MAVLMGEPLAHEDFRDTVNQLRRTGEVSLPSSEVCQILLEDPPQALPISALDPAAKPSDAAQTWY